MREEKPSATACLIAASLGFSSHDPQRVGLVNPLAAEASSWFMDAYGMPAALFTRLLNKSWIRPLIYAVERSTIPGILLHYLLRKRYLEETARQILEQGVRQVVILGAGFDMLSISLHGLFPKTTFIEVDYPATQATKIKALAHKHLIQDNLVFLPVNFMSQPLAENLLKNHRYQPNADTLFIAEGVLMYLSQVEVDLLFQFIRDHAGPGSRFAFTFMEPRFHGKINFHNRSKLVDFWMQIRGEPFTWGIPREKLPEYLKSLGFSLEGITTPDSFRTNYLKTNSLAQAPLAEGEYICLAKRTVR